MKDLLTLALVCSMLLAGCAGKKAMEDQAIKEVPPVAVEQEAVKAPEATPPEPVEVAPAPVAKSAADKIFFDFDSYLLTPASKDALEDNAQWLQDQPEVRIVIEGYADERGADTYNLALGENRSRVARDYLLKQGIAPDRIEVISYGEEKATRGAATEEVWAQDRRAEFVKIN